MVYKKILTTGYMGSGSSAVTDLLSEYDDIRCPNGSFEYIFLHCPNGVFDLEDKLLVGNNAYRSDEAIHMFMKTMKALYKKDGHWTGNYRNLLSQDFMQYCNDFIESLSPFRFNNVIWYYQQIPINIRMKSRLLLMRVFWKLSNGKIRLQRPVSYMDTVFAFPSEEQFYTAARAFLDRVFYDLGIKESSIVLDQLLLPQNLNRIDRYFDENTRVIIVERDPRDVYLLNKLVWASRDEMVPLPTEEKEFCSMYRKILEMGQYDDNRVLRIHFEDLVYHYDSTIKQIELFVGTSELAHNKKCAKFNPKRSIYNTQLFTQERFSNESVSIIERELRDFLYPFPKSLPEDAESVKIF